MKRLVYQLKMNIFQKTIKFRFVIFIILSLSFSSSAQGQLYSEHEENFAFEVKQIDEFIERFNDQNTLIKDYIFKKYDKMKVSREDLLKSLFNLKSSQLQKSDVNRFIQLVNDPQRPVLLSFYDDDWYAKVRVSVLYEKKVQDLFLLLRVQKEKDGSSKWVVHNVYADFLNSPEGNNPDAFLNPVSHATDFMALDRAFKDPENLRSYLSSSFQDDQLSKFAIEMQNNRISFQRVDNISYYFFQIDGWIFSVENFQRQDKNSGWLINKLIEADAEKKEEYKRYLLREKI